MIAQEARLSARGGRGRRSPSTVGVPVRSSSGILPAVPLKLRLVAKIPEEQVFQKGSTLTESFHSSAVTSRSRSARLRDRRIRIYVPQKLLAVLATGRGLLPSGLGLNRTAERFEERVQNYSMRSPQSVPSKPCVLRVDPPHSVTYRAHEREPSVRTEGVVAGASDIHSSLSARRRNSSGTEPATRNADP